MPSVTQVALWGGRWSAVKLKEEGICDFSEGLSITLDHFQSQRHRNHKKRGGGQKALKQTECSSGESEKFSCMTGREAAGVCCNSEIVLIWTLWHAVISLKGCTLHTTLNERIKVLRSYILLNMAILNNILERSCKLSCMCHLFQP